MKPTKAEVIEALKWCHEYRDTLQEFRRNDRLPQTVCQTEVGDPRSTAKVLITVQGEMVADLGKPPPYSFWVLDKLLESGEFRGLW